MKKFCILFLLLAGCSRIQGIEKAGTTNENLTIEILGRDSDGYTIKRFKDGEQYIYYVTPGPVTTVNMFKQGDDEIPTPIQTK